MTVLPLHIAAGVLALVFGYVALYATKGAAVHRKSGMLFVAAMLFALTLSVLAFKIGFEIAAGSFFWGPQDRVPEMIRFPALFPIPVLLPVGVMLYWLWRIRARRTPRGVVGVSAPETA